MTYATETQNKEVTINIIAELNMFGNKSVHLVKMHISTTRPKQFEDASGNLWNPTELSNFNHIK